MPINLSTAPLKIVSAYHGQAEYTRAARSKPPSDWGKLWLEYAVEPYWADWALGQFNVARTRQQLSQPILGLEGLAVEVECLVNSGIETLVQKAYLRITHRLPSPSPGRAVSIYAADPGNQWLRQQGVVGTGIGDNILLQINPLAENWSEWVPYVMAHEVHHATWGDHYFSLDRSPAWLKGKRLCTILPVPLSRS